MADSDLALSQIQDLVKKFKSLTTSGRKGMNENATRQGYILPMFRALGWNVDNVNEVSPEEKVSRGFVDFSFRLGGIPRYFLETKKASEDLQDPRWVQQAIDYAWTKSVTWALLSDFEGLRVFNAEWKESDPFRAQFIEFDLDGYISDFDRLWWLSRPETETGRLDQEADKVGKRIKRLPVSQHLFDDLKLWRSELYKSLRGYNPIIPPAQIDEAVLRLINRLIFIRTAEDREVEPPRLMPMLRELEDRHQMDKLSTKLAELFRQFDATYNSELFARHFSEELYCDRPPLEALIRGLYQKNFIRYNFNALDADVLGTAYEQYLGHVVTEADSETGLIAAASHVEEKRAKRKSQGIYYTPAFVTRYIVQQTVSRYLDEHGYNPSRPPRILDMACGSGSFLIEAFDSLDRFVAKQRNQAYGEGDDLRDNLRRLELLQTCIFGVDKDKQAVDVARLNLLLRALHGRQKLPLLTNIYNGDSLHLETWQQAFPEVMQEGGFDVIIGNPPYVRIQTLDKNEVGYFNRNFITAVGNYDIYVLFVEQALRKLKPGGMIGYILPNKFMQTDYGEGLRKLLTDKKSVWKLVNFGDAQAFENATTYTCLLFLLNTENRKFTYSNAEALIKQDSIKELSDNKLSFVEVDSARITSKPWILAGTGQNEVVDKLLANNYRMSDIAGRMFQGIRTSANEVYVLDAVSDVGDVFELQSKILGKRVRLESKLLKPFLRGEEIKAYSITRPTRYILIPYQTKNQGVELIPPNVFEREYPLCWEYLQQNRPLLEERENGKMKHEKWYAFVYPKNLDQFGQPKIITPDIAPRSSFALDKNGQYTFVSGYGIILNSDVTYSLHYVLALLNSRVLDFYLKKISSRLQQGFYRYFSQYIAQLPIKRINLAKSSEKATHDEIVRMAEEMLSLQKLHQQAEAGLEDSRYALKRRIDTLDREIDQKVYALYGLTEEEVKIVEGDK